MSGALPASFVPAIVMMHDNASLVLFIASEIIAIELESKPTKALNPAKTMFAIILIMLVLLQLFLYYFSFITTPNRIITYYKCDSNIYKVKKNAY